MRTEGDPAALEATCRFAVRRILIAEGKYEEELDRLCDQFSMTREELAPLMDRMMQEERKVGGGEVF